MAVFRVEKNINFTTMSNHHLKNKGLSLKAKGLQSLMLSLPDDWDYSLKGLAKISLEGVDSIREGLKELEKFGYVSRQRIRDEKGMLRGTDYDIYEEPIIENPRLDNPELDNPRQAEPRQEKQGLLNTNKQITKELNTNDINNSSILSHP